MDTTDPLIQFDEHGVCGYCRTYDRNLELHVHSGEEGQKRLAAIVEDVKRRGAGKRYDCVIGLSGGVDSSYTALTVKRLGLRPLAVHLDNGWDSGAAVSTSTGS
jgi:NH3-dependent NAD+ synthetase